MLVLHCTKPLFRRLGVQPTGTERASTTRLGDWTGTLVVRRPAHIVLLVSERSLLPVVIPAAPFVLLPQRFRDALAEVLRGIGVPPEAVAKELAEASKIRCAAARNRSVIGSMNDFRRMLPHHLEAGDTLLEASLRLAQAPCGPIGMESPRRVTLSLLGDGPA